TTEAGETSIGLSGTAPSPPTPPVGAPEGSAPATAVLTSAGVLGALGSYESLVVLEHLNLRFPASKSSGHKRRALVSYTLSSGASVHIVVSRRVVSHHCARGIRSCVRYLPTTIKPTVTGQAGADQLTLDLS